MAILCRVELSEARGKLRGLKIIHPDMGVVMDWGSSLPSANVRFVPQEMAFQMMADIERMKTHQLERRKAAAESQGAERAEERPSMIHALQGFFLARGQ